jgi:N-methylhydantoinase A
MNETARVLLGIDIGGSFTDVIAFNLDSGELTYAKTPTYNDDLMRSLMEAMEAVGVPSSDVSVIRHGTTVVINAILTRSGERTALVTTKGFRDVLEIGRTNWPEPYNLFFDRLPPLVPRERRFELGERMAAGGTVVNPVDLVEVELLAQAIAATGSDAIAICFLHSYANPEHERQVGEALARFLPETYITMSHELTREFREYERTSTVVTNAYVGGIVDRYIGAFNDHLIERGFAGSLYLMESNGGVTTAASARRRPVALVESGPAAGVMATAEISRATGIARSIAFDMGGTTAKACLVERGDPLFTSEYFVPDYEHGFPLRVAALDILEVGTGGGSLARVDNVGMLTVGPESAGAVPGPACFDAGGVEPTVTDANLVLGRLSAQHFLAGDRDLDVHKAREALTPLAERMGSDITTAAAGIIRIANINMAAAIRRISLDRGRDPRDFEMFAYGGGGPLHGVEIARELAIPRVVIPLMPGIFSALGMLLAELRQDFTRTFMRDLSSMNAQDLRGHFAELTREGESWAEQVGQNAQDRRTLQYIDLRYTGQEFAIMVAVEHPESPNVMSEVRAAFEAEYELRYGHAFPQLSVETVGLRTVEYVSLPKPLLAAIGDSVRKSNESQSHERPVHFEGLGYIDTPVISRDSLQVGHRRLGPLVIEEYGATTLIGPGDRLRVDELGQIVIDLARVNGEEDVEAGA